MCQTSSGNNRSSSPSSSYPDKTPSFRTQFFQLMTLNRRLSPVRVEEKPIKPSEGPVMKQSKTKYELLVASQVPSWYADNPFLRTGYRPVNGSIRACVNSLRCIHNETVNIYSHLIPAAVALAGNIVIHFYFRDRYPIAPRVDQLALQVCSTTTVLCFGISSIYHSLLCHSEHLSGLWNRLDYAGIIVQTVGSFVSGIYVTFYCYPGLQKLYWTMVGSHL